MIDANKMQVVVRVGSEVGKLSVCSFQEYGLLFSMNILIFIKKVIK